MQKRGSPRNRLVATALLPITILLWIIGWTLFWTGSKKAQLRNAHYPVKADGLEISTILTDEIQEYNKSP